MRPGLGANAERDATPIGGREREKAIEMLLAQVMLAHDCSTGPQRLLVLAERLLLCLLNG